MSCSSVSFVERFTSIGCQMGKDACSYNKHTAPCKLHISVTAHMHLCMHVQCTIYVCMHVSTACMYVCTYACMHACMHVCMYAFTCLCTCICYKQTDMCERACTYVYVTCVCMFAGMYVCCMYACMYSRYQPKFAGIEQPQRQQQQQ